MLYGGNPLLAMSYCYLIQGKCLTLRNDMPYEMQYVCEFDCKPVCVTPCVPCEVPCEVPCGNPCPPMKCVVCPGNARSSDRRQ